MAQSDSKPSILVVEDEAAILRGLCDVLAFHGFDPTGAESGSEGLREALSGRYDLLLLDVMLPEVSGFEICDTVRGRLPHQPILILTARGSEEAILEGFERGADDYVTKPFSVSELLARVKALLRRSGRLPGNGEGFAFGHWQVDPAALRATWAGNRVDLTPRELAILALFVREEGRIVSRRVLLQEVWGFENPDRLETRSVDMQIVKLRRKLDRDALSLIETARGAGYRYTAPRV